MVFLIVFLIENLKYPCQEPGCYLNFEKATYLYVNNLSFTYLAFKHMYLTQVADLVQEDVSEFQVCNKQFLSLKV